MTNKKVVNNYINLFESISSKYEEFQDILNIEDLEELKQFGKKFKSDSEYLLEENRKLRIGIVGQVKAGKSSFINALLFDGDDLLPKAATPMTAALTFISYSKKPFAKIEFYTTDEWDEIEVMGRECKKKISNERKRLSRNTDGNQIQQSDYDILKTLNLPDEFKAAYELINLAKKNNIDVYKFLNTEKELTEFKKTRDLIGALDEYVGANGKFTPIVKSTELYVDIESIKNIEIVDTPGINDPIISRGRKTREFLGKCDAVFLLSYAGQFMNSSDIGLLTQNIASKGIIDIILLGSKFDSALLDEGRKYSSLISAINGVSKKLESQASNTITPLVRKEGENTIFKSLKNSLPPGFISSLCYNIGKNYENLDKSESHILSRLKKTFPDTTFSRENLFDLSNIENIKDKNFKDIISKKDQILENRFQNLLKGQETYLIDKLGAIKSELDMNKEQLLNKDKKDLEKEKKYIHKQINKSNSKVNSFFDDEITDVSIKFDELIHDFKMASKKYKNIKTSTDSKDEFVRTERYGFLWLKKRDVYETVTFKTASTHQAIDQIEEFTLRCEKSINEKILSILDKKRISNKLNNIVLEIIDTESEDLDIDKLINLVKKTINKLLRNIHGSIDVDIHKYKSKIYNKFSNSSDSVLKDKVEDDEVEKLKQIQYKVIDNILKDISRLLEQKTDEIIKELNKTAKVFIDELIKDTEEKMNKIIEQINEKEKYLEMYTQIINYMEEDIVKLQENNKNEKNIKEVSTNSFEEFIS